MNSYYEWAQAQPYPTSRDTETTRALKETDDLCIPLLQTRPIPPLKVALHIKYLLKMLGPLPAGYVSLDATRPFMIFWAANGLSLMLPETEKLPDGIASSALSCQWHKGGFGGGSGQPPHLAPTYGAIQSLAVAGDESAWARIDRAGLYDFFLSVKQPDGSFRVCQSGETDPRGTYCALSVASQLNMLTPELTRGVGAYIASCQTYEGGFANMPLGEAHGGYAFCALATLFLLDPENPLQEASKHINLPALIRWLVALQRPETPGFAGRLNKLVDGCYSFWAGGCWALIEQLLPIASQASETDIWSRDGLREYIRCCCQADKGGLRDKPGKHQDAYHTNYVLCGLASSDYKYTMGRDVYHWSTAKMAETVVRPINPVFGTPLGTAPKMRQYFENIGPHEKNIQK